MDAVSHKQWNPNPTAVAAAVPFPGGLGDRATASGRGVANRVAALRAVFLAGGFHFVLRLLLLLRSLNY
jgi:hypothetical protein